MRGCHFRTRTYKPRASSLVRSQSHVHGGSSPWKRPSQVGRLSTVGQPASDAEGRYVERGNVRRYGLCARMITAIEDEGMMAKQWLGGVDCFGTGLRVCCLSAVAYCSGSVISLSFTHSLTHSFTARPWNTPRSYWTALHLFFVSIFGDTDTAIQRHPASSLRRFYYLRLVPSPLSHTS